MDEVELKFLNIDRDDIGALLHKIGAKKVLDQVVVDTYFVNGNDYAIADPGKKSLRVRQWPDRVVLTYKGPRKESDAKIVEEINVEELTDNVTCLFNYLKRNFVSAGMEVAGSYSKRRTRFDGGDVTFEIDKILDHSIKPYLEIEATNEGDLNEAIRRLGLDKNKADNRSVLEIYPEILRK